MGFQKRNKNKGPQMPMKLLKEIGGEGEQLQRRGNSRGQFKSRKERRRQERAYSKQRRVGSLGTIEDYDARSLSPAELHGRKLKTKKKAGLSLGDETTGQSHGLLKRKKRPSSHFGELLPPSAKAKMGGKLQGDDGEDPELRLQRQLAKKLGIKDDGIGKGPGDGLDDILNELDDVMGGKFDSESEEEEDEFAEMMRRGRRQGNVGKNGKEEIDESGEDVDLYTSSSEDSEEENDDKSEVEDTKDGELDEEDSLSNDTNEQQNGEISNEEESFSLDLEDDESLPGSREDEEEITTEEKPNSEKTEKLNSEAKKYIPPAQRALLSAKNTDEEGERVRRRVRGLVNRLADVNLQGIVSQLAEMYSSQGRSYVSGSLSSELITAAEKGPRASERFSVVAASSVAALSALTDSSEAIATFTSKLGQTLELSIEDKDSLACSNLVRLLGCMYLTKAIKPDIMFDILNSWCQVFSEQHIAAIYSLLTIAGLPLRKADPLEMKNFVISAHSIASEKDNLSTRCKMLMDLITDIKNNRMKKREGIVSFDSQSSMFSTLPPQTATWIKSCSIDSVAIGGLPWNTIIRKDKKGFWWMPTIHNNLNPAKMPAAATEDMPAADVDPLSHAELMKLAAGMRMSTDTRKSIFCVVMGSEDAIDATEKLLRLGLKGQQEREIVRVIVDCCLHENAWNPYYTILLQRLCQFAKGHRITLQYCIWDHIKEIDDMNIRKSAIFSKFCASIVSSDVLSLPAVIKTVDFSSTMQAKELLLWRVFFKALFEEIPTNEKLNDTFEKLAAHKNLSGLKRDVKNFLRYQVGPWMAKKPTNLKQDSQEKVSSLLTRCNTAEKILS